LVKELTIRRATPADVPSIMPLWVEMMQLHATLDDRFQPSEEGAASFDKALLEWLENERILILVADAGAELIGYAIGYDRDNPPVMLPARYGYITDMAVTAARRRQGVGSALLSAMTVWFRERNLHSIRLNVAYANPLSQGFWRSMGFKDYMNTLWGDIE